MWRQSADRLVAALRNAGRQGSTSALPLLIDLAYRIKLPWNAEATLAVMNAFDRDPPFARTELNYDSLTGDPIGRTVKFGVRKRF